MHISEHFIQKGSPMKERMKIVSSILTFLGDQLFCFALDWGVSQNRGLSVLNQKVPLN